MATSRLWELPVLDDDDDEDVPLVLLEGVGVVVFVEGSWMSCSLA